MATINQPELKFTPVEEIKDRVNTVRTTFFQHKTRPVEFRLLQLRKLYWAWVILLAHFFFYLLNIEFK